MAAVIEFDGWRWRNDDGSEATATWKAAENTNPDSNQLVMGAVYRCRVVISNTGDADTAGLNTYLRTSINGGAFERYGGNGIETFDSANLTHGGEPTNQMTSGQGTFDGGEISNNNNFTPNEIMSSGGYDEFEFVFRVADDGTFTEGDTVDFKHNTGSGGAGTDWDAYNVTIPQFTIVAALGNIPAAVHHLKQMAS